MATRRFRQRPTTKAVLLGLALAMTGGLALVVSALANPSFSDDYTATVTGFNLLGLWAAPLSKAHGQIPARVVIFGLNGFAGRGIDVGGKAVNNTAFSQKTEGDAFVDFSGMRVKYQTSWCDVNPACDVDALVDIYNFYNNGTGYLFWLDTEQKCWTHMSTYALPPMVEQAGTLSWLVNATKLTTPCSQFLNSGEIGEQYEKTGPGDGEVRDFCGSTDEKTPYWVTIQDGPRKSVTVEFNTYSAGKPALSVFQAPPRCGE
jgi:hypothetical protein